MPYPPFRLARRRVSATIWDIVFHFPSLLTATACQNCHYFRDGLKAAYWRKACTILPLKILSNLVVLDLYFPIFKGIYILQGFEDSERRSAHQTVRFDLHKTRDTLCISSPWDAAHSRTADIVICKTTYFVINSPMWPELPGLHLTFNLKPKPHWTSPTLHECSKPQNLDGNNQTQSIASSQKKRFGHKYLTANDGNGWKWKKPWSNPSPGHSWRSCTQQHQCGCHHQLQACNLFSQYQDLQTNVWESSPSVKISSK